MIRYFWPSDDEQLAGQFQKSYFDEDGGWWAGLQKSGAVVALATALALSTASTTAATSVFSQSQDDPAGNLTVQQVVDEVYWQNPVPPVNWPQTQAFTDDDVHPTFVSVFTPDDGDWQPLVAPVPATNYVQLPITDTEITPQFTAQVPVVDDSTIWVPQPPWEPTWTLLFFLDDGSTVPNFQPDEDFWVSGVAPVVWPQPAQPFRVADDDNFIEFFVGNDEAVWTPQVPPLADSLRVPQPFSFEQHEPAGNLTSFTNEDYWQNPTPPVPASIWLFRQDVFDTQDPVGFLTLILDDGFRPDFVPPVPDSLRLLQQWPFEQNEPAGSLRTLQDEDFWSNPTPPVVWPQPKLAFSDDDVIEFFVNTSIQDEVFQQQPVVPPVVATNLYNQPFNFLGNQEDDVPVLTPPPPPPPPPFCPLPPTGPDGDTKMSNFGGTKPTLALFCRICKSGNPLVVRADYAIWCQDCCAFVSKQDTYMGTVQAPGQFRSIF